MQDHCSYDYAIVRVVPRVDREEFVNAGVIVSCAARGFLDARIDLDEARLRGCLDVPRHIGREVVERREALGGEQRRSGRSRRVGEMTLHVWRVDHSRVGLKSAREDFEMRNVAR